MFIKNRKITNNIVFVSTNTSDKEDLTVDDLDRKHRLKGCVMFGGHYLIRRDGMIETGRELEKYGNAVRMFNRDSVFVYVVGNLDNITPQQHLAIEEIEEELTDMFPHTEIVNLMRGQDDKRQNKKPPRR